MVQAGDALLERVHGFFGAAVLGLGLGGRALHSLEIGFQHRAAGQLALQPLDGRGQLAALGLDLRQARLFLQHGQLLLEERAALLVEPRSLGGNSGQRSRAARLDLAEVSGGGVPAFQLGAQLLPAPVGGAHFGLRRQRELEDLALLVQRGQV